MEPAALPDLVIALGYPHWAAVLLAVATDRDEGIAVIDANGDGNAVCVDRLVCFNGVWSGNGGGSVSSGQTSTLAYACGEAEPGSVVTVEFLGSKHIVITEPSGWWAFAARVDDPDVQGPIPRRV